MSETKCIVLGEESKEENKKPIEFVKHVNVAFDVGLSEAGRKPSTYETIELVRGTESDSHYDLMYAYEGVRRHTGKGAIYLGHWNDGVVE